MSYVTDVFLGVSQKFSEQLCQRAIAFSCRYSQRNRWATQRLKRVLYGYNWGLFLLLPNVVLEYNFELVILSILNLLLLTDVL